MTQQTDRKLSRRGILAGLGAGGAAAVAAVVTTGGSASAAAGAPVVLGANNDAGATATTVHSTVDGATLDVENTSTTGGSTLAVKAHSTLGTGVDAAGFDNGVVGFSSDGNGVVGRTDIGYGVIGEANGAGAVGVVASAPQVESQTALSVRGSASFSRSGVATVAANATSVVVGGLAVFDSSRVLATAQRNTAVWVKAAVPSPTAGTVTLVLNAKAPAGGVPVVWLLIET